MALDIDHSSKPPEPDHITDGGGFYCSRCDTVDCEWLGMCPHTPDLWCSLNPHSPMAKFRRELAAARKDGEPGA